MKPETIGGRAVLIAALMRALLLRNNNSSRCIIDGGEAIALTGQQKHALVLGDVTPGSAPL